MKTIGVITVGRSDYGIYRPLLRVLASEPDFALRLYVSGTHLSPLHGETVREIEAEFAVAARIPMLADGNDAAAVARSMGQGTAGFASVFAGERIDLLIILGDRFEMHAAAAAAVPFGIPILHLHGGELTEGAMDDRFRHSLTKLSHLHAVAAEPYRHRVLQMGEEAWRVQTTGALALDSLRETPRWDRAAMESRFGLDLSVAPLLVTFHPTTVDGSPEAETVELLSALAETGLPVVFTRPNADMGGEAILARIRDFCAAHPRARLVDNFGPTGYFSMLEQAAAMVGNSSSGLLEAPSFRLPVVNVGARQQGRLRAANVIDAPPERVPLLAAIRRAVSPTFRDSLAPMESPFGDGHAAARIVAWLREIGDAPNLLHKKFHDLP